MTWVILAFGLVLVVEGLALALAPSRMEEVLRFFASLSRDRRRVLGLVSLAIGVALIWAARSFGTPI
ncbi:DUF2065 domain-containing protein [Xinfangfangia sp. CPCC 101601]|uniref:DUF2065 domain-containing protein n=1 Tax=Pseudogemmobacter lacusdianii TaxID=3069608 RepID=A0ABU0VVJ2_9RHOB|nr:DUF2065 domain-containing protein [Xinfangfangia sp. CPCC 101601]MDQ2065769.1 DUF2065 domain-containing protein [Xinfangfangia sp. CPCC 101601]